MKVILNRLQRKLNMKTLNMNGKSTTIECDCYIDINDFVEIYVSEKLDKQTTKQSLK